MIDVAKVGRFLAERQKAVGLTQEQLAERMHVTHQAVSKWENGISLPDAGLLLDLAAVVATTVESMLMGAHSRRRGSRRSFPVKNATEATIEGSEDAVGYRVRIMHRPEFQVAGFTKVIPPHDKTGMVRSFAAETAGDGRVDALRRASASPPWILGLGSWNKECEPGGQRYTICVEETPDTDLRELDLRHKLFRQGSRQKLAERPSA